MQMNQLKIVKDLRQSTSPWVRYRILLDIDWLPLGDPGVLAEKAAMLAHPLIADLLSELKGWPGVVLSSHKSAGQLYHKLAFLAEIGLTADDSDLAPVLEQIASHLSDEGLPQLTSNISSSYGGSGQDISAWALCDTPLQLWTLLKMSSAHRSELLQGVDYLIRLVRDNGWPCTVSKELGKFRGPGRKDDPCPYATLLMVKLLLLPELGMAERPETLAGIDCLLELWQNSLIRHPYMFYMGTDFRKLKVPFIWYDLLHVAEVLSQSPVARRDPRFREMVDLINSKAGSDGRFTPESEWKAWSSWEFGQKKLTSDYLTFLVCRLNSRIY